ncbi:hypothetical protein SLEP1_g17984 [Rubroshorea leprosula]|uniref:Uncharacterized protein n=1 Tax=Rubroshorea leprosula TaxID=152421 RepID=A0AAV5IW27_9ROSI|nr:hypothetical protein SLEP1_g17984 [Rubroshorea leprosula]
MSSQQRREDLDARARQGEVVVPGGTGGKSLEAQEHLAEGNMLSAFILDYWFRGMLVRNVVFRCYAV